MKAFFCYLFGMFAAVSAAENPYALEKATTQSEMNQAAARDLRDADAELNRVYQEILTLNRDDAVFVSRFREAQGAWIKYRDAHVESCWPDPERRFYGSVHPMCRALALARMTLARVEELKAFRERVDGDVCACAGNPASEKKTDSKK